MLLEINRIVEGYLEQLILLRVTWKTKDIAG